MVFALICDQEVSDLIIMRRDMSSKRQGYTASSYIEALQLGLPSIWQPDRILQQDNARVHTAKKTKAFLKQQGIRWIHDWPPFSPDLNCIEHFWGLLKNRVYELYPDMEKWSSADGMIIERMEDALVHAWGTLDRQIVHTCTESMTRRCQAVVDANGWYTRY